jgi:hypothetical protein
MQLYMNRQQETRKWLQMAGALLFVGALAACSSAKMGVSVPSAFKAEATEMRVKGVNGWPINERVRFGNYRSTRIRRGWNTTTSRRAGNWSQQQLEDMLFQRFGVGTQELSTRQKDRFRFEIETDGIFAEVYAREQRLSNSTEVRTNTILGSWERTQNYRYTFSASVIPDKAQPNEVWQLQLTNVYDRTKDTARRFFDQPYVEEQGLATNGTDSIYIRSIYISKYEHKDGRQGNMPFRIPGGYELKWDGGLVCIVDTFGKKIWLHNDLEPKDKLLLGAMATAILLRRIDES